MKEIITIMSKISHGLIYVAMITLIFSCDPLEDVYKELDEGKVEGETIDLTLVLSDADYSLALAYAENANDSSSMKTFKNFSDAQARKYIPYILSSKYPALGIGSSVLTTYNFYQGNASAVNTYTRATSYVISEEDYASVGESTGLAGFFSPSFSPAVEIPKILKSSVQDGIEGAVYAVSYTYSSTDPEFDYENADDQVVYTEGFTTDISAYTKVEVSGAQDVWSYQVYGDGCAQGSRYSGGNQDNEEWLVSPEIDLTSLTEAKLLMSHVTRFLSGLTISDYLNVKISTDYTGDITTATWETINFSSWVDAGSSNTFVDIDTDISNFAGSKITLAFAYKSTTVAAARWQLGQVSITTPGTIGIIAEEPVAYLDYYTLGSTGNWSKDAKAYSLTVPDYDAMGAPGQNNNFSSSIVADDYIPTFLKIKYPYAKEEDELVVIYKYYSSTSQSVSTRGNVYTYLGGAWNAYTTVVEASLAFGREATAWVPDNTVKISLDAEAVSFIAKWKGLETGPGANYNSFGSFDTRSSSGNYWSSDDLLGAFSAYLAFKYPNSQIDQKYQITYKIYDGALKEVSKSVILKESGYEYL
jgi:hypothetical protein